MTAAMLTALWGCSRTRQHFGLQANISRFPLTESLDTFKYWRQDGTRRKVRASGRLFAFMLSKEGMSGSDFFQPMILHLLTRFATRQSWWPHGGMERQNWVIKRVSGIHCEKALMPRQYLILNINNCWFHYLYLWLDIFIKPAGGGVGNSPGIVSHSDSSSLNHK